MSLKGQSSSRAARCTTQACTGRCRAHLRRGGRRGEFPRRVRRLRRRPGLRRPDRLHGPRRQRPEHRPADRRPGTFNRKSAARTWRQDALVALRAGTLAEAKPKTTVREACEAWLVDARAGIVRTRGVDAFKPSTLRAYELHLRLRVYPRLDSAVLPGPPRRPAGSRRPTARRRCGPGDDRHDARRDRGRVHPRRPARRARGQSGSRRQAAGDPQRADALCRSRRGRLAAGRGAGARPTDLGYSDVRRPAPRRADGPALGGRRARRRHDPRRAGLGPRGSDEHQEPRAPAGADHRGPARAPRRPTPTPDPGRRPGLRARTRNVPSTHRRRRHAPTMGGRRQASTA